MIDHIKALLLTLGAAACFYFTGVVKQEGLRLEADSRRLMDPVLFPKTAPTPGAPVRRDEGEQSLWQPDPGLVVKQPENQKAVQESAALANRAAEQKQWSEILHYGGFALLALLAFLEAGMLLRCFRGRDTGASADGAGRDSTNLDSEQRGSQTRRVP